MLKLYGASDDLVEAEGILCDEFNLPDKGAIRFTIGWPEASHFNDSAGLIVEIAYGRMSGAVWSHTISPIEEGAAIPWDVHVEIAEVPYSCAVIVDCPNETPIKVEEIDKHGKVVRNAMDRREDV